MKKVFVTRKLLKENEQKLQELFEVKLNSNDKIYMGFTAVSDQMYSNWQNNKNIIYSFSKIRFIFAKRIHTRTNQVEKREIWN